MFNSIQFEGHDIPSTSTERRYSKIRISFLDSHTPLTLPKLFPLCYFVDVHSSSTQTHVDLVHDLVHTARLLHDQNA